MSSSDSFWLNLWSIVATVGFAIVIVGVVIEGVEHFKKFPRKEYARKLQIEKLGWFLVVAGLAMEFLGDHAAKRISDRESARLNDEAGVARREAGEAIKQAGAVNKLAADANERAAKFERQAEVLRAANISLKVKLQPRRITQQEEEKFIWLLSDVHKFPVRVYVGEEDSETRNYASHIRTMLNKAGFGTGLDDAVKHLGQASIGIPVGDVNETSMDSPFVMVLFGEPEKRIDWPGLTVVFTNGQCIFNYTNDASGFGVINSAFNQIGIKPATIAATNWFVHKPGDWGIFIHQKF